MIYKITEDLTLIPITQPTEEEKRMMETLERVKKKHPKLFAMIKESLKNEQETIDFTLKSCYYRGSDLTIIA